MVPSPRKRVTRASFNQTWDDSDAATFDPSSLPVARIPRGWERKQEIKRTEQGREKKIWRRIGLRSRASNTVEEDDDEEHDARSRAVKKQQHMSPKAMEKTASKSNGKKRAFKATRYDRRKSVLPSKEVSCFPKKHANRKPGKKKTQLDDSLLDEQEEGDDSEQEQDAIGADLSYETLGDVLPVHESKAEEAHVLPLQEDRRSTFTFSVYPEHVEVSFEHEVPAKPIEDCEEELELDAPMEDATITRLFRSPCKHSRDPSEDVSQPLQYPELPQTDSDEVASDVPILTYDNGQYVEMQDAKETEADAQDAYSDAEAHGLLAEGDVPLEIGEQEGAAAETSAEVPEELYSAQEQIPADMSGTTGLAPSDIVYPSLPVEITQDDAEDQPVSSLSASQNELNEEEPPSSNAVQEESPEQSVNIDIDMEDELVEEGAPDTTADEEFTEASLQLDILRNAETEQTEQPAAVTPEPLATSADAEQDDRRTTTSDELPITDAAPSDNATMDGPRADDITDGLTLSFTPAKTPTSDPAPRKLHSPPPPPTQSGYDDATMTIALDDDTALLKDFLTRAAASKAEKAAVLTHRRESLQNRRDSDVIRHALA